MTAGLPRMAHFAVACSLFYLFALFTAGAIRSVVEQYAMLGGRPFPVIVQTEEFSRPGAGVVDLFISDFSIPDYLFFSLIFFKTNIILNLKRKTAVYICKCISR